MDIRDAVALPVDAANTGRCDTGGMSTIASTRRFRPQWHPLYALKVVGWSLMAILAGLVTLYQG